jgi:outer membrane protein assembly factor BamB
MRFQGINIAPIVCHDLDTGEELWSLDFEGTNSRSVPRGFRDGRIYATNFQETGHDTLYALDPDSGAIIWRAEKTVDLGIVWAVVYDSAGNIIIPGSGAHITKIDKSDGNIIWDIPRAQPNTGAEGLVVFGNTLYGWTGYINTPKKVTAWNLADGTEKYSSATLPGDGDQETTPTIGPDGTIYALRDGGQLHALRDNGGGFDELWTVSISGTGPTAQFGIGIDGSVYRPDGTTLVRLDQNSGQVIDRSVDLISTPPLSPRITVDASGELYVINGTSSEGMIYVLSPALEIIWSEPLPYNYYSGPALGENGTLAVAGNGDILRVYKTQTAIHFDDPIPLNFELVQNYPNPCNSSTVITFYLLRPCHVRLQIFNPLGQLVKRLVDDYHSMGEYSITWDGKDNQEQIVGSGVYFYRLQAGGKSLTRRMAIAK